MDLSPAKFGQTHYDYQNQALAKGECLSKELPLKRTELVILTIGDYIKSRGKQTRRYSANTIAEQ